jgi:hypothetical protein
MSLNIKMFLCLDTYPSVRFISRSGILRNPTEEGGKGTRRIAAGEAKRREEAENRVGFRLICFESKKAEPERETREKPLKI